MMSEPAQKCKNLANFKQKYTLELFIALEMVYYCCLSLGGNLDFLNFLQKKCFNINYCSHSFQFCHVKLSSVQTGCVKCS